MLHVLAARDGRPVDLDEARLAHPAVAARRAAATEGLATFGAHVLDQVHVRLAATLVDPGRLQVVTTTRPTDAAGRAVILRAVGVGRGTLAALLLDLGG